jgi:hypothetical protein
VESRFGQGIADELANLARPTQGKKRGNGGYATQEHVSLLWRLTSARSVCYDRNLRRRLDSLHGRELKIWEQQGKGRISIDQEDRRLQEKKSSIAPKFCAIIAARTHIELCRKPSCAVHSKRMDGQIDIRLAKETGLWFQILRHTSRGRNKNFSICHHSFSCLDFLLKFTS